MKKVLLLAIFILTIATTALAGQYDGFWVTSVLPDEFFFIRGNEGFVVVVRLSGPFWEAYAGPISNNSAVITTLRTSDFFLNVNVSAILSFNSTTSGQVRINFCTPIQNCLFPSGTVFQIEKIF